MFYNGADSVRGNGEDALTLGRVMMNLSKHGKKKAIYWGMVLLLLCLCFYVVVNLEMKNNDNKNAANEQEYVNPYAEYTETFSGGYLYDIYEANRGSNTDGE